MKNFFDTSNKQETVSSERPIMQDLNEDDLKCVTGGIWHEHQYNQHFFRREFHHGPWRAWHEHRGWEGHR